MDSDNHPVTAQDLVKQLEPVLPPVLHTEEPLVTASDLERIGVMRKGTVYKMLSAGMIKGFRVGAKQRGVRFRVSEVLAALRRPAFSHKTVTR